MLNLMRKEGTEKEDRGSGYNKLLYRQDFFSGDV